jgi:lysophospholipase L1-like esterase
MNCWCDKSVESGLGLSGSGSMENLRGGGVVFVGDSITAAGRWERFFPEVRSSNFGVDGDCSEDVLRRLGPVVESKPRKLFLMIGTNDLGRGYGEDSIVANVAAILDRLRAALPDCLMYLQSVLPREAVYSDRVRSLNRRYAEVARERGVSFIDLFGLFADDDGGLRGALTEDGLHLVDAGYEVWRGAIARHVG